MGIDWTFAGEAVEYGGFMVRATAVLVSVGGMLVTALMLGIVSGVAHVRSVLLGDHRYLPARWLSAIQEPCAIRASAK